MGKLTDGIGASVGGGDLPPGGVRIIEVRDKSGAVVKTLTIYRTNRPYACDLADAYNAGMDRAAKDRGAEWYVAPNGELKLGYSDKSIRENRKRQEGSLETERARYLRRQFDPVEPA